MPDLCCLHESDADSATHTPASDEVSSCVVLSMCAANSAFTVLINAAALQVRINAWFGSRTVSCNHTDPPHNLLCQVVGHKVVRLYHPDHSDCMYPHNGLMNNTSQVDPENVDADKYPKFNSAPYWEFVLSPGEM